MIAAPLSLPSPPDWARGIPIGPFFLHSYAICILVGILLAMWITARRMTARGAEPGTTEVFAFFAVILGIIGARAYHVLTHPSDYFFVAGRNLLDSLFEITAIWNGGNAIFGSLIGGALGVLIASRVTGVRFWSFADALVPGLLVAQAVGRFGNYFNVELYGRPTDLPWGLEVPVSNAAFPAGLEAGTLFHPTFLYEMLWNLFGVVVLLLIERQVRPRWGRFFALYLVWYGVGRVWFESLRIDPSETLLGIRTNVWTAAAAVLLGIVVFVLQRRRHPGREVDVYRQGRGWERPTRTVGSRYTEADFSDHGDDAAGPAGSHDPVGDGTATATSGARRL